MIAPAEPEVLVEVLQDVMVVTVNRPRQRNAITLDCARLIAAAMDRLDSEDALRVGILAGAGGTFSAGMDLKRFAAGERPSIADRGFAGLVESPPRKPLVAAVDGWALGGGFEMVLACDLVVAAADARFGLPEVTRGLVARGGGMLRLPSRIPRSVAMELLLTGRPLDAARATGLGLVNRLVTDGPALPAAIDLAREIAANAPLAVQCSKAVAGKAAHWSADEMWRRQLAFSDKVFTSADAREGALAFQEKRPPTWSGR